MEIEKKTHVFGDQESEIKRTMNETTRSKNVRIFGISVISHRGSRKENTTRRIKRSPSFS